MLIVVMLCDKSGEGKGLELTCYIDGAFKFQKV